MRERRSREAYYPLIVKGLIAVGLGTLAWSSYTVAHHLANADQQEQAAVHAQTIGQGQEAEYHAVAAESSHDRAVNVAATAICSLMTLGALAGGIQVTEILLRPSRIQQTNQE